MSSLVEELMFVCIVVSSSANVNQPVSNIRYSIIKFSQPVSTCLLENKCSTHVNRVQCSYAKKNEFETQECFSETLVGQSVGEEENETATLRIESDVTVEPHPADLRCPQGDVVSKVKSVVYKFPKRKFVDVIEGKPNCRQLGETKNCSVEMSPKIKFWKTNEWCSFKSVAVESYLLSKCSGFTKCIDIIIPRMMADVTSKTTCFKSPEELKTFKFDCSMRVYACYAVMAEIGYICGKGILTLHLLLRICLNLTNKFSTFCTTHFVKIFITIIKK